MLWVTLPNDEAVHRAVGILERHGGDRTDVHTIEVGHSQA